MEKTNIEHYEPAPNNHEEKVRKQINQGFFDELPTALTNAIQNNPQLGKKLMIALAQFMNKEKEKLEAMDIHDPETIALLIHNDSRRTISELRKVFEYLEIDLSEITQTEEGKLHMELTLLNAFTRAAVAYSKASTD